jgi:hypothetical protein
MAGLGRIARHRIDGLGLQRHDLARWRIRRRLKIATPAAAREAQRQEDKAQDGASTAERTIHTTAPVSLGLINQAFGKTKPQAGIALNSLVF